MATEEKKAPVEEESDGHRGSASRRIDKRAAALPEGNVDPVFEAKAQVLNKSVNATYYQSHRLTCALYLAPS